MLVLGSSNPVRDVDLAVAGPIADEVLANRGLAGIDGVVSTAVGIALTRTPAPTYALLGDLTFLHDANGLLIGPDEPTPDLTLVVVNDDGGGIFTTLEHGAPERAADFERVFGTPTGTDLAALCRAHGIRHDLVSTARRPDRGGRRAAARHPGRRGRGRPRHPPAGARRPARPRRRGPPRLIAKSTREPDPGRVACRVGTSAGCTKDRFQRARHAVARMRG